MNDYINIDNTKACLQNGKTTKIGITKKQLIKLITGKRFITPSLSQQQCVEMLLVWIENNIQSCSPKLAQELKFRRNVPQILESKLSTGCHDFALVFASMARVLDIPTTIIDSIEKSCFDEMLKNGKPDGKIYRGHAMCECKIDNKWILVDPTSKKIYPSYDVKNPEIEVRGRENHNITYIKYARYTDIAQVCINSVRTNNEFMDNYVQQIAAMPEQQGVMVAERANVIKL